MRIIFVVLFICLAAVSNANVILNEFEQQYKDIQTISATFTQLADDNSLITGEFYLKKPNKIIWKYLKPYPITILIKDNTLTYYDHQLDEISYRNIKNSIFSVLLGNHLNLNRKLVSSTQNGSLKHLTFKDKFLNEPFTLKFFFTSKPFVLKSLILSDDAQELSNITFTHFKKNVSVADEIFTIKRAFLKKK
jgi:outer membrane lipoprotein-sorting protein